MCGPNTIPIAISNVDEVNDGKIMGLLPAGHTRVQSGKSFVETVHWIEYVTWYSLPGSQAQINNQAQIAPRGTQVKGLKTYRGAFKGSLATKLLR